MANIVYQTLPRGDPGPDTDKRVRRAIDALRAAVAEISDRYLLIEARTSDPTDPEVGRIWLRTDL